jgi:hypothetical protein
MTARPPLGVTSGSAWSSQSAPASGWSWRCCCRRNRRAAVDGTDSPDHPAWRWVDVRRGNEAEAGPAKCAANCAAVSPVRSDGDVRSDPPVAARTGSLLEPGDGPASHLPGRGAGTGSPRPVGDRRGQPPLHPGHAPDALGALTAVDGHRLLPLTAGRRVRSRAAGVTRTEDDDAESAEVRGEGVREPVADVGPGLRHPL